MISRWAMWGLRFSRLLGVRVFFFAFLALMAAFLAPSVEPLLPASLMQRFSEDAVLPILNILASTMLAVTTFSLGVMVQAFRAAATLATPRAYRIVMQDTTTQTVLATFTGAFLFSLTAIVMFRADYYGKAAPVVVFALTVLTIALIIVAILRWISHLSQLGSLDHTLAMVQQAAKRPLDLHLSRPALGGVIRLGPVPRGKPLSAPHSGYVQFIDMHYLQTCLTDCNARLHITAPPGTHVVRGQAIGVVQGGSTTLDTDLHTGFTIADQRTLEQDARFGLMVLNEVGMRALSPGINDPGTAIDIIHRLTALLSDAGVPSQDGPLFDRITLAPENAHDLIQDAYYTLVRDGVTRPEVATKLITAFATLKASDWPEMAQAAQHATRYVLDQAELRGLDEGALADLRAKAQT